MIYTSREECYTDIYTSLMVGVLVVEDIKYLKNFYEEIEHYECCQGVVDAYIDYEKWRKQDVENSSESSMASEN